MTAMPPSSAADSRPVLITGGAGFIGSNLAHELLSSGRPVIVFDNLSRPGVVQNLEWLRQVHGRAVNFRHADIRDAQAVVSAVRHVSAVFHLAAQVAVTTSLSDPKTDFSINVAGTLNLLEALRELPAPPPLLFTSTHKVYGNLEDIPLRLRSERYEPLDSDLRVSGIDENRSLHFSTPYGCSKGAADQYVLDYAKSFGLRAAVFRMSCIYGPRQFGTEDQGWVAHFLIQSRMGSALTFYGDGCQVRDVLYVHDLVRAFLLAEQNIDRLSGEAFNLGGGPANVTSLRGLVKRIGRLRQGPPEVVYQSWRMGDQRYYVSNTRKFEQATGWSAAVPVEKGIGLLDEWLETHEKHRPLLAAC
jgi:CDP-paratose 2-epimerase